MPSKFHHGPVCVYWKMKCRKYTIIVKFVYLFACWVIFSNICFFRNFQKIHCFHPFYLLIYNLNVKQFGSQMKPHILWGFIWIQIVCKGHQRSSKLTASGLKVKGSFCAGFSLFPAHSHRFSNTFTFRRL